MSLAASLPALGWDGVVLRLGAAALLGGAIGLERELDEKSAGLRTHILVSVGSALFTLVSAYGFHEFLVNGGSVVRADPGRIAAQIVTGIGFLGAGVIFRQGFAVRGLTTAASLWMVAAIGMASGAGFWAGAVIATGGTLLFLRPLVWARNRLIGERGPERLVVQLADGAPSAPVLAELERIGTVRSLRHEGGRVEIEVELGKHERGNAIAAVAQLHEVEEARWGA